jgi:hypothetical protein
VMERLHAKGLISDPRGKAKSVVVSEEAAGREMWQFESRELIPPMDEHGIDEPDLSGKDDDIQTLPPRTPGSHPDAARSPP